MADVDVLRDQAARADAASSFGYSLSVFADRAGEGEDEGTTIRRIMASSPLRSRSVRCSTGAALLAAGLAVKKTDGPCHYSVEMHTDGGDPFAIFVACFGEVVRVS